MIMATDDDEKLNKLYNFFNEISDNSGDWWNHLNKSQKASIEKGLEQAESGKLSSNEEVSRRIDRLFDNAKRA